MDPCSMLLLVLIVTVATAWAARGDAPSPTTCQRTERKRRVNLLITRHGFSCANNLELYGTGMRGWANTLKNILKDPLLTESGCKAAQQTGLEVTRWLETKGLAVDMVISSILARAVETAALQYPDRTVYPVPFINELGFTMDNRVDNHPDQMLNVDREVRRFGVNFSWDKRYRYAFNGDADPNPNWEEFLKLLADRVLPDLESEFRKGEENSDRDITLAVVTHSHFMSTGVVAEKCSHAYACPGGKVTVCNNQVVMLSYDFSYSEPDQHTCNDRSPYYMLQPVEEPCTNVANGLRLRRKCGGKVSQCARDVGAYCTEKIRSLPITRFRDLDVVERKLKRNAANRAKLAKGERVGEPVLESGSEEENCEKQLEESTEDGAEEKAEDEAEEEDEEKNDTEEKAEDEAEKKDDAEEKAKEHAPSPGKRWARIRTVARFKTAINGVQANARKTVNAMKKTKPMTLEEIRSTQEKLEAERAQLMQEVCLDGKPWETPSEEIWPYGIE